MLVGPSKQLTQMNQIEHNIVRNPNWPEANQLAIYKRAQGFEQRCYRETNPGNVLSGTRTRDRWIKLLVQHAVPARPRCLLKEGYFLSRNAKTLYLRIAKSEKLFSQTPSVFAQATQIQGRRYENKIIWRPLDFC